MSYCLPSSNQHHQYILEPSCVELRVFVYILSRHFIFPTRYKSNETLGGSRTSFMAIAQILSTWRGLCRTQSWSICWQQLIGGRDAMIHRHGGNYLSCSGMVFCCSVVIISETRHQLALLYDSPERIGHFRQFQQKKCDPVTDFMIQFLKALNRYSGSRYKGMTRCKHVVRGGNSIW